MNISAGLQASAFAALFLQVVSPSIAHASCNSFPTVSEVTASGTQASPIAVSSNGTPMAVPAEELARYRFKGALGRIDDAFFLSGPMRLTADGVCVQRGDPAVLPQLRSIGDPRDVVIFVIFDPQPGYPTPVWAYRARPASAASEAFSLARLRESLASPLALTGKTARLLPDEWDTAAEPILIAPGIVGLSVPLPPLTPGTGSAMQADLAIDSASVRIVAMHVGGRATTDVALELTRRITSDCTSGCTDFLRKGGVVCVDRIFQRVPDTVANFFVYEEDPFNCSVDAPVDKTFNDFASECEVDAALPPGSADLASCGGSPSTLRFWLSDCGGIHFPLDYGAIRKKNQGPGLVVSVNRTLAGRSGVGRGKNADDRRIFVPGREFVGSSPPDDVNATNPDKTRWRFPELDVWYPAGNNAAEFGLTGLADKNASVIHVLPRRPAYKTYAKSDGTQVACFGISSNGMYAACDRSSAPECWDSCQPTDAKGRYFACVGGGRSDMPCTRDAHCEKKDATEPNDGTCSRQPICRPKGTVWYYDSARIQHSPGATNCWADDDCGETEQCGFSLFDFSGRLDSSGKINPTGIQYLDYTLRTAPGSRIRRGTCADTERQTPCSNSAKPGRPPKCANGKSCGGYELVAGEEVP